MSSIERNASAEAMEEERIVRALYTRFISTPDGQKFRNHLCRHFNHNAPVFGRNESSHQAAVQSGKQDVLNFILHMSTPTK